MDETGNETGVDKKVAKARERLNLTGINLIKVNPDDVSHLPDGKVVITTPTGSELGIELPPKEYLDNKARARALKRSKDTA